MKHFYLFIAGLIGLTGPLLSQPIPIETMAGQHNFWLQQVVSKQMNNSRWGYFNVSSLHAFYDETPEELMSQSYLTYKVNQGIKLGVGTFYASAPGFSPSVNIQFAHQGKNHFILAIPRVDLTHKPAYDIMAMAEFFPALNKQLKLYSRIQTMFNYTNQYHNRSYQNIRLGLDFDAFQAGIAANFDAYGRNITYTANYGIFFRKPIF